MQISDVRAGAAQILDDWCGTKPRPLPWPGPKGPTPLFDAISNVFSKVALTLNHCRRRSLMVGGVAQCRESHPCQILHRSMR